MRYATRVLIFLVVLNAGAAAFVQSGAAADWGISPNPGGTEEIEQANETASSFGASGGFGDTLFGLFTSVTSTFENVIGVATAAPSMLGNFGIPNWLTAFIFAPMYLLVSFDLVYLLTGRST